MILITCQDSVAMIRHMDYEMVCNARGRRMGLDGFHDPNADQIPIDGAISCFGQVLAAGPMDLDDQTASRTFNTKVLNWICRYGF